MRSGFKIALSLLISVIIFTAFIIISFSGLFDYIEATFYHNRVKQVYENQVRELADSIDSFHDENIRKIQIIYDTDILARNFLPNLSQEDIFKTENLFEAIKKEISGLLFIRLIDNQNRIHYSTLADDLKESTQFKKVYKNYEPETGNLDLFN